MARLSLSPGQTFNTVGGLSVTDVIGTNSNETVHVAFDGKVVFDSTFNRGGDTIVIGGSAAEFSARTVGSNVEFTNAAGASIAVPLGAGQTTIRFDDLDAPLGLTGGAVNLGSTAITGAAASILPPVAGAAVPIIVLAGQSNANLPATSSDLVKRLEADGGAYEFARVAQGGTSLFANANNDWDPETSGELTDQLIEQINAAIANVEAQGQVPEVSILWVQGENDAAQTSGAYLAKLTDFFEKVRGGIGQPDARFVISPLPVDGTVRTAQFIAASTLNNVDIIESRGIPTFDGVHYIDEAAAWIAGQFFDVVRPETPQLPGYVDLVPDVTTAVNGDTVTITTSLTAFRFASFDGRNYRISAQGGATGENGNEEIFLGSGRDDVRTGGGADIVDAGGGNDFVDGGPGNDRIFGGDGNDFILGRQGIDYISGGNGDDSIGAGSENDMVLGGAGNDVIVGEGGADTLYGGEGADTFRYDSASDSRGSALDLIGDFESGIDTIDMKALGELGFVGTAAFTGVGQVRYEIAGNVTTVSVNLSGDVIPEMAINLSGAIALAAGDFVFA